MFINSGQKVVCKVESCCSGGPGWVCIVNAHTPIPPYTSIYPYDSGSLVFKSLGRTTPALAAVEAKNWLSSQGITTYYGPILSGMIG